MSPEILSLLMLAGVLLLAVMGAPVAFSLATLGLGFGLLGIGPTVLPLFINRVYGLMNNAVSRQFLFLSLWGSCLKAAE